MTVADAWTILPRITPAAPVLALLPSADGLWAGGYGSIALKQTDGAWEPRLTGLALTSVLAIAEAGSTLFAAGVGGVACSTDRGAAWHMAAGTESFTVLSVSPSPEFADDATVLAGVQEQGVIRSSDSGVTWTASNFGLRGNEVSALLWLDTRVVLAATEHGLHRSTNGGRAWRPLKTSPLLALARLNDGVVALAADGGLWRSDDSGVTWTQFAAPDQPIEPQAMSTLPDGSFLIATAENEVLRTRGENRWLPAGDLNALTFARDRDRVFAGTEHGVVAFDPVTTSWGPIDSPPLHDLQRVHAHAGMIFVSGVLSAPWRWRADSGWTELIACPVPLLALTSGPGNDLIASTPDGVFASTDDGDNWQQRSTGPGGAWLTMREDGAGWMASADGSRLSTTRDGGSSWAELTSPFGVLPLVALQANQTAPFDMSLLAATYDRQRQAATLWRSTDDGETWQRGGAAITPWPTVATLGAPLAMTVGNAVIVRLPDGRWIRSAPDQGGVRRLAASTSGLVALTTTSLWLHGSGDESWRPVDLEVPNERVLDIALDRETLVVLLTNGDVRTRAITTG